MLAIYAVTNGLMDDIPVDKVSRFERELRDYFRTRVSDVLDGIRSTGKLPEGDALAEGIAAFKEGFVSEDEA